MKFHNIYLTLLMIGILPACTMGPASNSYTARTLGKGNADIQAAVTTDAPATMRIGYGLDEHNDIGILAEDQRTFLLGVWAKHAFTNNINNLLISLETSAGYSKNSSYFYIGPIIGYKLNRFEPYIGIRYNYLDTTVTYDLFEESNTYRHSGHYGTLSLGNTAWISPNVGLNVFAALSLGDITNLNYGVGLVKRF